MTLVRRHLRTFISSVVLATAATTMAQAADVVIVKSGGAAQEAAKKAIWEPAAKALGLTFEGDTSQSWAESKAQVDSGSVTWDIVSLNMGEVPLAVKAGILTKLPSDIVDRNDYVAGSANDYCIGNTVFSANIGYSTRMFGDLGPANMVDFWDVKKFPGKRGMYRSPRANMEAATLALGHPQSEVYEFLSTEEGRQAALAKLAELKPYVIWWDSGAQATQLVKAGEVAMIYAWNGRIMAAIDDGAPYKLVYKDGLLDVDCYAILKGAPHPQKALAFLKEISKPEYGKDLPRYFAYGTPDKKSYNGMSEAMLSRLTSSPKNVAQEYTTNFDFWGKYGTVLSEQFDQMLASN